MIARYSHALLVMVSQTAACNRLHTVDMRMCRWLKMTHNRIQRPEFPMRQEFLAQMLGVHRPSVSIAANTLQKAGLISYSRGRMQLLDVEGLAEGACECNELIEPQFDHIFGQPWRALAQAQHAQEEEDV
jgi:Mn-dependent DtxR family transcriptional regulator